MNLQEMTIVTRKIDCDKMGVNIKRMNGLWERQPAKYLHLWKLLSTC